jgi:hypothetical protein
MPNQSRPFVGPCDHYVSVATSQSSSDSERWNALMCLRDHLETGAELTRTARMQLYAAKNQGNSELIFQIIALSRIPAEERADRCAKSASVTEQWEDEPVPQWTGAHTKADGESRAIKSPRQARTQHRRWSRKVHDRKRWLERRAKQLGQDS